MVHFLGLEMTRIFTLHPQLALVLEHSFPQSPI
jgi:hypothetical protein